MDVNQFFVLLNNFPSYMDNTVNESTQDTGNMTFSRPLFIWFTLTSSSPFSFFVCVVCSVRVIGESDIMQEFLSESDEVCITFVHVAVASWFFYSWVMQCCHFWNNRHCYMGCAGLNLAICSFKSCGFGWGKFSCKSFKTLSDVQLVFYKTRNLHGTTESCLLYYPMLFP